MARSNSAASRISSPAHHRQRHQMMRIATDGGAEVEHDRISTGGRPYGGERRPVNAGQHAQAKPRHRRQRAGIAGGHRDVGVALLDGIDRQPHRRGLAAAAQCLAGFVVHTDGDIGMNHARYRLHCRMFRQFRVDHRMIAEQQKFGVGMSAQRNRGAGNDDRCADIATHGVKRDSNLLRHERPGNLIFCGLGALGRGL
jgi:hypothetical protein